MHVNLEAKDPSKTKIIEDLIRKRHFLQHGVLTNLDQLRGSTVQIMSERIHFLASVIDPNENLFVLVLTRGLAAIMTLLNGALFGVMLDDISAPANMPPVFYQHIKDPIEHRLRAMTGYLLRFGHMRGESAPFWRPGIITEKPFLLASHDCLALALIWFMRATSQKIADDLLIELNDYHDKLVVSDLTNFHNRNIHIYLANIAHAHHLANRLVLESHSSNYEIACRGLASVMQVLYEVTSGQQMHADPLPFVFNHVESTTEHIRWALDGIHLIVQ